MGSGKILKLSHAKYGLDNFSKDILFNLPSLEEMYEKEKELVTEDFIKRPDTYNLKVGGDGGWDYAATLDSRRKGAIAANASRTFESRSNSSKKSVETRKRNGTWHIVGGGHKGIKLSDSHKANIGKANAVSQLGSGNSQFGTCWIYSEIDLKTIKIKKEDLTTWLNKGWLRGRNQFMSR